MKATDKIVAPKALVISSDVARGTVTYTIRDHQALVLELDRLTAACRSAAMARGMSDKVRDMIANMKETTHSDASRYGVVRSAVDYFNAGGDWNKAERTGGGNDSLVITAMARVYPAKGVKGAEETIAAYMAKKGITRKEALETWGNTRQVAAAIVEIKAERAAALAAKAGLDADDMLEDLLGDAD